MTTDNAINTNAFGESYLPHINGSVFAHGKAETVFCQRTDADLFREDHLHLVIGTDSGLLIDYIRGQGIPAGATYLFIEPPDLLPTIKSLQPAIQQQPPIGLCLPTDWMLCAEPFDLETYVLKRQVLIHPCIATLDTAKDIYEPIVQKVYNELDAAAYTIKAPYAGGSMIEMKLANLSENIVPVNGLYNSFSGKTAIVLGAGPSLDDHIAWIQEHRHKLFILAASRLCKRLYRRYKLAPDIVVSVDSQEVNYQHGRWLFDLPPEKTILAYSNHVSPQLVAQWHGRSCYIGDLYPWDSVDNITDNMQEEGGPTVSNSALVLAGKMGFDTILLSGVDLCTPLGVASHSGSRRIQRSTDYIHEVPTYDGQIAKTNVNMVHAANLLGEQAKEATGATTINLSAFACKIDGIEHRPVANIQLGDDIPADWDHHLSAPSCQQRLAHNQHTLQVLQQSYRDLRKMRDLAAEAIKLNQKMYRRDQDGNYNVAAKRKLDKIKQRFDTEFSYLAIPIRKIGIDFFVEAMTTRDVSQMDDHEREALGENYYNAFKKGSVMLSSLVESSLERVQSRIEEDSPSPNIARLITQWQQDKQYLRARVWQHWHPQQYQQLDAEIQDKLQAIKAHGLQNKERGYSDYTKFIGPTPNKAWYIREHIYQAYLQKDIGSLKQATDLLNDTELTEERIQALTDLIRLCLSLLLNQAEAFKAVFAGVNSSDLDITLYLDAITMALSLSDNNLVNSAFLGLCGLDIKYLPEYANWLKAAGFIADAADVYTEYLKYCPEDISVWLTLAELYDNAGEAEMSNAVYQFVLELDPENSRAKAHLG